MYGNKRVPKFLEITKVSRVKAIDLRLERRNDEVLVSDFTVEF